MLNRQNAVGGHRDPSIPRLGICIPAYRRPAHLELCLRSIITAIGHEVVPIVIADDSGDDTNAEVVSRARDRYPRIEWHRNPNNLGIDENILSVVSRCEAEFAWLMGEDDLLTSQAVSRVLSILQSSDPRFLFVNYSYVSNDYRYYLKRRVVDLEADCTLTLVDLVEKYAWAMGFIGSCVINRRLWSARDDFVGTYYAHVASILTGVKTGDVVMIADPLVLNRAENVRSFTWAGSTFDVLFGWERMLRGLHREDPSFDLGLALGNSAVLFRQRTLGWLVSKRADGLYSLRSFRLDPRLREGSWIRRTLGLLVAVCPRWLCRAVKFGARDLPRLVRRERIDPAVVPPRPFERRPDTWARTE